MVACQPYHVHFVGSGDQSEMEVIKEASLLIELSGMLKISQSQIMENIAQAKIFFPIFPRPHLAAQ
jgi:hypothetical protein